MKINGRDIASGIFETLKKRVAILKKKNITPHLAVILVGNDPASHAYVNQKQKKGEEIGVLVTVHMYAEDVTTEQLLREILMLNQDPLMHGIIIQQPLPAQIDVKQLINTTNPEKDVDGFHKNSSFTPPIAEAAMRTLEEVYFSSEVEKKSSRLAVYPEHSRRARSNSNDFADWLQQKQIVVLGKGETGGAPIIAKLKKLSTEPTVIDSKTKNPKEILKQSDIVISCVGRRGVVRSDDLKQGVILIGIGMHKGEDGKLHADYEEEEIEKVAGYYTPVPGGIGPINVAMLLQNVLLAAGG